MIYIPDYYKIFDKYTRLKRKYKEDTTKLRLESKKSTEMIDNLQKIINEISEESYYRNLFIIERDKYIEQLKENSNIIDKNTKLIEDKIKLEEKLAFTIKDGALLLKIKKEK